MIKIIESLVPLRARLEATVKDVEDLGAFEVKLKDAERNGSDIKIAAFRTQLSESIQNVRSYADAAKKALGELASKIESEASAQISSIQERIAQAKDLVVLDSLSKELETAEASLQVAPSRHVRTSLTKFVASVRQVWSKRQAVVQKDLASQAAADQAERLAADRKRLLDDARAAAEALAVDQFSSVVAYAAAVRNVFGSLNDAGLAQAIIDGKVSDVVMAKLQAIRVEIPQAGDIENFANIREALRAVSFDLFEISQEKKALLQNDIDSVS